MSIYTKTGKRTPSGVVKPTLISDELAIFLGEPLGIELARTQVTREINDYIRTNRLNDNENGRRINPDEKLATLLKISPGEELNYFNLQRFMSPHFFNSKIESDERIRKDKMRLLEDEIREMRKEIKQININVEELLKRKLSVVEYFNRKIKDTD